MRVPTNTASAATINLLSKLSSQQSLLQNRIGTGQRISAPSDDPATVGRIIGLESKHHFSARFEKNARSALETSQVSFDGLDQLRSVSVRASELLTLASGSVGDEQMAAYAKEVDQLLEHALQLGNTKFGGQYLFGGTEVKAAPFTAERVDGVITGVSYGGEAEGAAIRISESSTVQPRTSGETNEGLAVFMNRLVELRDALESGDTEPVNDLRAGLEQSEDLLIASLSEQGSVQARIEVNLRLQESWQQNIDQMISSDVEVDVARSMVELNEATIAYEAALAASSKILNLSILDYLR